MKFKDFERSVLSSYKSKGGESNSNKNLAAILNIVKSINSSLILDDVLELVLKNAILITNSDRGFIVLHDDETELIFELGLDSNGKKLDEYSFEISRSVVEEVFRSGLSKFVENAQDEHDGISTKSILDLNLQTILCSPLIIDNKKIGVIYVDSKNFHKINSGEITETFEILTGQAAIAIKNAKLYNGQLKAYKALQKANQELTIAKEKSEKSEELKSEFLAQMSHEIRTPLNIIINFSNMIREEYSDQLDKALFDDFCTIENAAKRIIRTVDLILNMSELQSGTYRTHENQFDLIKSVMMPLFMTFESEAKEKLLELRMTSPKSIMLKGDEYAVFQIFSHLIDNAIKYTEIGSVNIDIKLIENKIVAEIADTGIGIDEKYIGKIYEPFTQEHQGYSRKFEGNGLGLSLVKRLCEINNFDIRVESNKGEGTTFSIIISMD